MANNNSFGGSSWSDWLGPSSSPRGLLGSSPRGLLGSSPRGLLSSSGDATRTYPGGSTRPGERTYPGPGREPPYQGRFANPFANEYWKRGRNLDYLNSTPDAAYALFSQLFGGPSRTNDWLSGQYNKLWGQYSGGLSNNPQLTWTDYLAQQNLGNMYYSTDPRSRGENAGVYAPRLRYLGF